MAGSCGVLLCLGIFSLHGDRRQRTESQRERERVRQTEEQQHTTNRIKSNGCVGRGEEVRPEGTEEGGRGERGERRGERGEGRGKGSGEGRATYRQPCWVSGR